MAELDDTVEEVLAGFDGTETYTEAEYALRDYSAKEISVNAAKIARALEEGVLPPGSVDADAVAVTPFGSIAADNVQDALEEIVAEASGGAPLDWTAVTWENGWDDLADYAPVEYAKDTVRNEVVFRGVADPGGNNTSFTLPAGFRPTTKTILCAKGAGGNFAAADVNTNGTVTWFAGGDTANVVIEGSSFFLN